MFHLEVRQGQSKAVFSQEAQLANPMVNAKFFDNVNSVGNMTQCHHRFKSCFYACIGLVVKGESF